MLNDSNGEPVLGITVLFHQLGVVRDVASILVYMHGILEQQIWRSTHDLFTFNKIEQPSKLKNLMFKKENNQI